MHPVFVWDAQYHPVKGVFTHVDFFGVDLNKEIKVDVPLEFVGTSKGVKLGGTLETYRERVTLAGPPAGHAPQAGRERDRHGAEQQHPRFGTRAA